MQAGQAGKLGTPPLLMSENFCGVPARVMPLLFGFACLGKGHQ